MTDPAPAYATFAAGDVVTLTIPVDVWNATTSAWEPEASTIGGTWEACIVSANGLIRHSAVVSGTSSVSGVVAVSFTPEQTEVIPHGVLRLSLRRTDGGPRTYAPASVSVMPARP